jgi:hypothetical protein
MFGYGFAISDVRVTLQNGSEVDCLQKIFGVGRHVAAGFAGSVQIGFAMIDEFRRLADICDERIACDPQSIAADTPGQARRIFATFPPEEQKNKCHLMVICVDPQAHVGNPHILRSHVYIFKSPDFDVEVIPTHELGSIGSGLESEECQAIVNSFSTDPKRREIFWHGELGQPGGMASVLGSALTGILTKVQPRGVSAHLNYCWVYRGHTIITTNDHSVMGRWTVGALGSGINEPDRVASQERLRSAASKDGFPFEMPHIATSWDVLCRILAAMGASASECTA